MHNGAEQRDLCAGENPACPGYGNSPSLSAGAVTLTRAKDQLHGWAQGCSCVVIALLNSGLCSGGCAGSPEDPSHSTALHHVVLSYLSHLPAPSSLPGPASLGVQGHLLRAEGRASSAEKGMEGRLIFLAVSTATEWLFHIYLLALISNSTVSWEVRLEEQRYQWLHHGRSHRLQRLVVAAGNCFCDNCEDLNLVMQHTMFLEKHTLQTSLHGVVVNVRAWSQNCTLPFLSAPRMSAD